MKESNIVSAICRLLQYLENQGKLFFIRNNSGAFLRVYQDKYGRKKQGFYRVGKTGTSDIILFLPTGKTIFLEVKTEKGKQSDEQVEFENKIKKLGFDYYIVRSLDDVENILKNNKILS